jgi:hypothetical protein
LVLVELALVIVVKVSFVKAGGIPQSRDEAVKRSPGMWLNSAS